MTVSTTGAERTADRREFVHRLVALLFWFALPVVAVISVVSAVHTFSERIDAQPVGSKGTYVAQLRSCQGNVCQVAGTFTSDGGFYVVRNVLGDYRWKVGESHRVVLNPYSEIIALPAQWNPVATTMGIVGGVILFAVWGWLVVRAWRRRAGPGRHLPGGDAPSGRETTDTGAAAALHRTDPVD